MPEGPKQFRPLLRAEGVSVGLWDCRGDNRTPGHEQLSFAPTVNVPLRGVYARHGPHGDQILDPMTVSLSNRGEVWRSSHPGPCGDVGLYVVLDPVAVEALLPCQSDADAGAPFTRSYLHLDGPAWLAWSALAADLRDGLLSDGAALDTVHHLLEALGPAPTLPAHAHALSREARAVLARGPMPLPALARLLGVSPFHLCRCFRGSTGTTLHAWEEGLRLRRAARHLEGAPADLSALALDAGFSSHAHFTTRFRRAFGVTPSAWRGRRAAPTGHRSARS